MQWQPGYKLSNHPYEIEQIIGVGRMGISYQARHLDSDIPVVIKTPNSGWHSESFYEQYIQNFEEEAKKLAQLGLNSHPHIVQIRDFLRVDSLPCLIMEFIPGKSLAPTVETKGALSESTAIELARQIGSALAVCHQEGVIHRDISPHNIILRSDNNHAVLIDFGIAEHIQTDFNSYCGNPIFAPWEQLAFWEQQNSQTPQIDIYGLAASLYFSVTQEKPTPCMARKYSNTPLREPIQVNPNLSHELNDFILRGMALEPQDRPNNVREWLELLPLSDTNSSSFQLIHSPEINKTSTDNSVIDSSENLTQRLTQKEPSIFSSIATDKDQENNDLSESVLKSLELAQAGDEELQAIKDYAIIKKIFDYQDACRFIHIENYLALHQYTKNLFLLKVISDNAVTPWDEYSPEPDLKPAYRSIEEFKKIDLNHPNLLPINNCCFSKITFKLFVINQIKDSYTIQNLIEQRGKISIKQAIDITLQILAGLDYAHNEKQLFHGDLKPENIFLTTRNEGDYTAKIAHCGVFNYFRNSTGVTRCMSFSDFHFMLTAPDFGCYEPWVDVYSTAAILYYMLTGSVPVDLEESEKIEFYQIQKNNPERLKPTPIRQKNNSIPQPLAELIDWALRERNFKNARALKNALLSISI